MRKIILLIGLLPFMLQAQVTRILFNNEYCQVLSASDGTLLLGEFLSSCVLETQQVVTKHSEMNTLTVDKFPDYPTLGTWVEKDQIYNYNGELVQVIQDHAITEFNPHDVPALFSFYRAETGSLEWIENEKVSVGDERIYNIVKYRCIQAHMTFSTYRPDLTVGVLWEVVPTTQEWTVGVAYKVNDLVTYQGSTYKCLQAHTSIVTWYPSAVPALWQKQ